MSKKSKNKPRAVAAATATPIKPNWTPNTGQMKSGKVQMTGPDTNTPAMPTVYYTPEVATQMDFIVAQCTEEVGWLGLVTHYEALDSFLIHRIMVPEQEVHSTTTEISDEGLEKVALDLIEEGEDTSQMYAWYHSHVNMPVNPSSQDELQVAEYLDSCPIFIRGIVNKKGDSKVDVYYRDHNIAYTCVPTQVHHTFAIDPTEGLADILKERVKKKVYAPVYNTYGNYYGNNRPYSTYPSSPNTYQPPTTSRAVTTGDSTFDANMQREFDPAIYEDEYDDENYVIDEGDAPTNDEMMALYEDNPNYTGYGFDWDEMDQIAYRPDGWEIDELYIMHGHAHDTLGAYYHRSLKEKEQSYHPYESY